jgi:hypothetical protein
MQLDGNAGLRTKRPNIVFIVSDDLGFADLGCYGGRPAKFGAISPVLDTLAADGLKFTQGYSNSPVCSPTRFALMTARYQYRLRGAAEEPISIRTRGSTTLGLPPEQPTLPSLLRNPQPALHGAALALGNARRRSTGAGGEEQPLSPARRQHPDVPPHDPPHGRRHRLGHGCAARTRARREHARGLHQR